MDSSFQLTIAYDMLYYVKFTVLSIKTISRSLDSCRFADISTPCCRNGSRTSAHLC